MILTKNLTIQYVYCIYGWWRLRISCPKISPQNQLNIYFANRQYRLGIAKLKNVFRSFLTHFKIAATEFPNFSQNFYWLTDSLTHSLINAYRQWQSLRLFLYYSTLLFFEMCLFADHSTSSVISRFYWSLPLFSIPYSTATYVDDNSQYAHSGLGARLG